jgi:tRNA(Ile)-lysidine synthase
MVMLELFARSPFKYGIAHCNFQLRGADSDADGQLVRERAGQLGVPFHTIRFNTMAYAGNRGISMEMAARELRYAWFKEISGTNGYTKIATAHHRDDAEETFLLNLSRGCGIRGLHGIPASSGNLIRPMRGFSKQEILQYATANGIRFREDATNGEDICQRNIVRHHILPAFRRLNPQFDTNMDKTMRILQSQEAVYFHHIREVGERLLQPDGDGFRISREALSQLPFAETYLFEILHPYGFNEAQIQSLLATSTDSKGKRWESGSHCLRAHGNEFLLQPVQEPLPTYRLQLAENGTVSGCPFLHGWVTENTQPLPTDPSHACFDTARLRFPLQVRYWQAGDRFVPFGMTGSKKLSDLFTDLKIDCGQKKRIPLICNGNGDILWVAGHRSDNRYRVTPQTTRILTLHYLQP